MMRVFLKDDIDYQALKVRNLENVEPLFETEESVPDIFRYEDSYYTFCVINRAENWMIVEKFKLYDLNDIDYTDEITCPYCNSSQSDSWEAPDEGDYECETCGGTYEFQRNVEVSYSSTPFKKPEIRELKKFRNRAY